MTCAKRKEFIELGPDSRIPNKNDKNESVLTRTLGSILLFQRVGVRERSLEFFRRYSCGSAQPLKRHGSSLGSSNDLYSKGVGSVKASVVITEVSIVCEDESFSWHDEVDLLGSAEV